MKNLPIASCLICGQERELAVSVVVTGDAHSGVCFSCRDAAKQKTIFDSTAETLKHIRQVAHLLWQVICSLGKRISLHDASKLQEPEKSMYDKFTPMLGSMTYGSDEYKATLLEMGVALEHHYAENTHHPEHFPNGINGMSLLDVMEMLADWKAASLRHADGDIMKSLEFNQARFGISDQLFEILKNTLIEMGWAVRK